MKTPKFAGFVGHDGEPVWVEPHVTHEDDSPLVVAYPDLFDDDESVKRGPGRPAKVPFVKPHAVD